MFVDLIYKSCGIDLGDNRKELIKTRFQKIIKRLGCKTYRDYYDTVIKDNAGDLFSEMIDAISTNHTFFFREKDRFVFLQKKAFPNIINDKLSKRNKKIRIWCAAASSGEEPYTTIITLLETINLSGWDLKMLATDISSKVLKKALEGLYVPNQLKEMPPLLIDKYFDRQDIDKTKTYLVKNDVKKYISYRKFNLMSPQFPFRNKFDIIFCRNVIIYFDVETQQKLVQKFLDYLDPGGYLFIGHSENISGPIRSKLKPLGPAVFQKI